MSEFFVGEYLAKLQARVCLSQALAGLANTLLKDEESALDNHVCRCGGILNTHLTVNLLTNLLTKFFFVNRLRFGRIMDMCLWSRFLAHPVLVHRMPNSRRPPYTTRVASGGVN